MFSFMKMIKHEDIPPITYLSDRWDIFEFKYLVSMLAIN